VTIVFTRAASAPQPW